MSWEHLHILSHSFPIVLSISGSLVGLFGWWRGKEALELWGLVALIVGAAFVLPAYLTGLAAADVVAERTFVRPGVVQTHRFWATWAAIPVFSAGALAAFALHEREDTKLRRFVLLVGLFATVVIGYAAWLGSQVVHGETEDVSLLESGHSVRDVSRLSQRTRVETRATLVSRRLEQHHEPEEDHRAGAHSHGLKK